jgi:hypothetical protein
VPHRIGCYGGLGETVRRVLSQEDWPQVNTMICKKAQDNSGTQATCAVGLLISRDKPHLRLLGVLAELPARLLPER